MSSIERRLAAAEAIHAARSDEGLSDAERGIRAGDLRFLLHTGQVEALAAFDGAKGSRFVLEVARRWGKTWLLLVLAFMVCMRARKVRVVYGAPTLKHLAEFVLPTFEALTERFPRHLAPKWNANKSHIEFPNGSYIHLFGADDKHKADRGRGPSAALAIFDEAGFCPLLRYVLRSVFRPSLLHSGGRTIVASTPAELPDHDFTTIAEKAEANGAYFNRDVWSNPLLTREQIEKFIADDAHDEGISVEAYIDSDDFRREYLAERVINRTLLAVPEWAQWREARFVRVPRPPLFRGHTTIDFGGHDPHAALFGYWHGELGLVVERELLLKHDEPSRLLSDEVKRVEREVWGVDRWDGSLQSLTSANIRQHWGDKLPTWLLPKVDQEAPPQPYHRISDTNMELARHLYTVGLSVVPTRKTEKHLMANQLRNLIRDGQFWLDPSCVDTDRHLRQTTWRNEKRKEWARRADEHGDLVDCAIYKTLNVSHEIPLAPSTRAPPPLLPQTGKRDRLSARLAARHH